MKFDFYVQNNYLFCLQFKGNTIDHLLFYFKAERL